jgi:large subunit ribosomal protein L10
VQKSDKERVVQELTERLKAADTLIVADYRGLSMTEIDELRGRLLEQGARFSVVKNTLTRRAAEAAGTDALLALLEGPTGIAFLESGGDPVAVAKTLSDTARDTRILTIRGGLLEGAPVSAEEIERLAKLPPADVLRGQVLGAIIAPLNAIVGLVTAPLQNLHGLIDARIEQLEAQGGGAAADEPAPGQEAEQEPAPSQEPEDESAPSEEAGEEPAEAEETPAEETTEAAETTEEE